MSSFTKQAFVLLLVPVSVLMTSLSIDTARGEDCLEVIAAPTIGPGPLTVNLEAKVKNMEEPVQCFWYFGDGERSKGKTPPPHRYAFGKYNLIVRAVDGMGKVCTAGVYIESEFPG